MSLLKIGQVARESNVGIETIRYYEREGLLAPPDRRPSGYRQYDASVVARLQFIRRSKELGFTLAEIKELLSLWFDANTRCEHVRERAKRKIADIEDKVRALQKMKRSLHKVIRECQTRDSVAACPIWSALGATDVNAVDDKSTRKQKRKS